MITVTAARIPNPDLAGSREIVFRTRGTTHGSITRLASPSDLGQMLKPFVFLDLFAADPARVVLGQSGGAVSPIRAPSGINHLDVRLAPGERWTYRPPAGHSVGWMAVETGTVLTPEPVSAGELAVFAAGDAAIHFQAPQGARFVPRGADERRSRDRAHRSRVAGRGQVDLMD